MEMGRFHHPHMKPGMERRVLLRNGKLDTPLEPFLKS
jgi:hypothetical protein